MLNNVTLVGRIIELSENQVILATPRPYKNTEGIYDTDYITCKMYKNINNMALEYCKVSDLIAVKGRLQSNDKKEMSLVVDKISFLTSRKEN